MDVDAVVRRYYDALDTHAYDALESVLAPDFVQRRPDRTFESRASFVEFMRDSRPQTDTRHELREVITDENRVVVCGRLRDAEGDELFAFADVFELEDGRIAGLETYTR
ncbi:nuclear transport factor 2 family protein [Natribaculum luteum]|uniref:Nuclear transport factor 2 family protein n=1 Tax=Natribaculum luteum TaxID=1586232 RepID=A0ABD5P743_9EURY|nr:nuclear transport factor 2 family protein [Natribaculum luteum]